MPRRRSTSNRRGWPVGGVVGILLMAAAVLVGCVGGGVLFAPATRAGQDTDNGVIGMVVFDMHEGDEYWIYQEAGADWPDSIECRYSGTPEHTYVVTRAARPWAAEERRSDLGTEYAFYGSFQGHRTQAGVLVECPFDEYLLVPSRAPLWRLGIVALAAVGTGLVGLLVLVLSAVRRARRRAAQRAVATSPAGTAAPAPAPAPARGPAPGRRRYPLSPAWYLVAVLFPVAAVCVCGLGGVVGLSSGLLDSFEPPEIGTAGSGAVTDVFGVGTEYVLYAEEADPQPDGAACRLEDSDTGVPTVTYTFRGDRQFGVPETVTENDSSYRYVGTFEVDDVILGTIRCEEGSSLLLRPSPRPRLFAWAGAGLGSGILLMGVAVAAGIALARRRAEARAAGPAAAGPGAPVDPL